MFRLVCEGRDLTLRQLLPRRGRRGRPIDSIAAI